MDILVRIKQVPETSMESLCKLKPSFKKDGTVRVELGIKPMAKIVSYGLKGLAPKIMGYGPFRVTKLAFYWFISGRRKHSFAN